MGDGPAVVVVSLGGLGGSAPPGGGGVVEANERPRGPAEGAQMREASTGIGARIGKRGKLLLG